MVLQVEPYLRMQPVWTSNIIPRYKPIVLTVCGRNPVSGLLATGVPPHILLANEIIKIHAELSFVRSTLLTKLEELPEEILRSILQNFNVNGTVSITRDEVVSLLSEFQNSLKSYIREVSVPAASNNNECSDPSRPSPSQGPMQWTWKGRIHPVPEGFRFPR